MRDSPIEQCGTGSPTHATSSDKLGRLAKSNRWSPSTRQMLLVPDRIRIQKSQVELPQTATTSGSVIGAGYRPTSDTNPEARSIRSPPNARHQTSPGWRHAHQTCIPSGCCQGLAKENEEFPPRMIRWDVQPMEHPSQENGVSTPSHYFHPRPM